MTTSTRGIATAPSLGLPSRQNAVRYVSTLQPERGANRSRTAGSMKDGADQHLVHHSFGGHEYGQLGLVPVV
jgi:hypothetical protein